MQDVCKGAVMTEQRVTVEITDGVADVRLAHVWTEIPVQVIAAVTGNALGGGLQIALGADIRIVAPDARMSVMEIRWGLVPDMTGTQLLPELVGRDVAKELTLCSGSQYLAHGERTNP